MVGRDSMVAPGIRFVAVARQWDRVLLASHRHDTAGRSLQDQQDLIHKVLNSERATQNHPRLTVTDREHGSLHYDSDREYFYVAITEPEYSQRIAFKCLSELRERFIGSYGEEAQKAAADGLTKAARSLLADVCERFEDPGAFDRVLSCTKEVDEVRGILHGTVNSMLSNADNLEVLEDKAEEMRHRGEVFQKRARGVASDMRWRNRKLNCAGCCLTLFVIMLMIAPFVVEYWPELYRCVTARGCDFSRSNSTDSAELGGLDEAPNCTNLSLANLSLAELAAWNASAASVANGSWLGANLSAVAAWCNLSANATALSAELEGFIFNLFELLPG
uniref:V-SNARE coiled-coil homology domain-containing protein n=1 Tax=Prymnesium polylepis TaxID=72548 RepID=A0A6V4JR94_9EUKA|mmetsp:Transcript_38225/g.95419  ORF Transcript_38225/g.95419 Transcript_38225/m.95419 type:complete len:333 (+) Transcript_38225:44-1042(+)